MKLFIVSRQHSIKMEIAMCWKICIHCKAKFINSDVNSRGKKTVEIFISLALLLLHENLICQLFLHTTAAFNIEELFWCACSKKYVGIVNNHRKIHKVARFYVFLHAGTKPRNNALFNSDFTDFSNDDFWWLLRCLRIREKFIYSRFDDNDGSGTDFKDVFWFKAL